MGKFRLTQPSRESKIEFKTSQTVHLFVDEKLVASRQLPESQQAINVDDVDEFTRHLLIDKGIFINQETRYDAKWQDIKAGALVALAGAAATGAAIYESVVSNSNLIKAASALGATASALFASAGGKIISSSLANRTFDTVQPTQIINQLESLAPEGNLNPTQT